MQRIVRGQELRYDRKETLNEMFWKSVESFEDVDAMKYWSDGKLRSVSYAAFGERVKNLAKGLMELGIKPGDRVAIYSDTRYEWELFDFAAMTAGAIVVTVHSVLNKQQVEYIIRDSESSIVIAEEKLLDKLSDLEVKVVTIEESEKSEYSLKDVEEIGRRSGISDEEYEAVWRGVKPDDVSSIVYTSGTTGEPKGAMLTHWNWRFNAMSVMSITPFYPGEPHICYLPLSHVYQRLVFFAGVSKGATAVFCTPQQFVDTSTTVKPVGLIVVPRVLERVNKGILENVEKQSALKKKIFYWARDVAIECGKKMSKGEDYGFLLSLKWKIANKLVYSKIKKGLGLERIRFICSAAAELQKNLAYMFNGMGIPVIEGYGMTETAAPSNLNPVGRFKPGTVGPPIPGVEEAIADDGEILIRGDNVMKGYWKKPLQTREAFTPDGWLKTGDLGEFDEDGYLIFLGRKKHIIVLDTGKNVSPMPIEEELVRNPYISDALIVGDGKPYIAALIQPNFNLLVELADRLGIDYDRSKTVIKKGLSGEDEIVAVDENLLKHPKIQEFYSKIVEEANRKFAKHEIIRKFRLIPEAFSIERGELTPTLKKRQHVILKNYERYIEEMYGSR